MTTGNRLTELREAGELQRRLCEENGSALYAQIIAALVGELTGGGAAPGLLRADERDAVGSALYLRLLGAVHRLALTDPACPLREFFPSTGGRADAPGAVETFFAVVEDHADLIAREMRTDVQTNEVGRSAPLSAALNQVAGSAGGLPLRLLEVGASAGLNLRLDRYFVDAGTGSWGPGDSPVRLVGHFVSGRPPTDPPRIGDRRGCDLNPIQLDERGRQVLRSFVWPEHTERLRRLDAALAVFEPVALDRDDAVSWLARELADLPEGSVTVVFHSIVLTYLSADQRAELDRTVREAGAGADARRRLAWIQYEPTDDFTETWLTCERWPERDRNRLAIGTPHGTDVRWEPTALP
jgi:hypothetical protein